MRDQVGCPTYTGHLASGLVRLLDTEEYGIHHMAGGGRCSWWEFAGEPATLRRELRGNPDPRFLEEGAARP